jgi:hypothetical protein
LDDAASDQLLVPFAKNMRLKTPNQVDTLFAQAKKNRSIKSAIQAEELLLAITSSSQQNDRWVSYMYHCSRSKADVIRMVHIE